MTSVGCSLVAVLGLFNAVASHFAEHELQWLWHTALVAPRPVDLPRAGIGLVFLHWQGDSYPLDHQGSLKQVSFKCLQSSFVNGTNSLTAISLLSTHAQQNSKCKISLEQTFDLNKKSCFHRVIQICAFCSCRCKSSQNTVFLNNYKPEDYSASLVGLYFLVFMWSVI